jgi:hypothetical protein
VACKLTIFTATEVTTASRWASAALTPPANVKHHGAGNCVEFTIALQALRRRALDPETAEDVTPVRMPIPANDNVRLSYLPAKG